MSKKIFLLFIITFQPICRWSVKIKTKIPKDYFQVVFWERWDRYCYYYQLLLIIIITVSYISVILITNYYHTKSTTIMMHGSWKTAGTCFIYIYRVYILDKLILCHYIQSLNGCIFVGGFSIDIGCPKNDISLVLLVIIKDNLILGSLAYAV